MNKSKFDGFINRYSLNGNIESVFVESEANKLNVKFISDDKTLLGSVSATDLNFPEGEYGIFTTSALVKFLSVLNETVTVSSTNESLQFADEKTKVNYMLAQKSVIPDVPKLKQLPEFNVELKLDSDFVSKFIKSKNAIGNDSDSFTFVSKDGKNQIILGYSSQNTNRISITVDATTTGDVSHIAFSAKYLKEILQVNKDAKTAVMKISSNGLAHLIFEDDIYKSEYYLVEVK
jgi:DNA polymerase III sliding clamp (beta) subunit (PCNA family)